jgi:hypothetical protein
MDEEPDDIAYLEERTDGSRLVGSDGEKPPVYRVPRHASLDTPLLIKLALA